MKKIDLEKIFWSKCRKKILEKFFLEFESGNTEWFYMRELSRELWEQINSVKRELDNLSDMWLLRSKLLSKKKTFYLNRNFLLLDEFRGIFVKSFDPIPSLKEYFKKQRDLDLVLINESLQNRLIEWSNNVVDILIIWDIDKIGFNEQLAKIFFDKKIKYATLSKEDFYKRLEFSDKLILDILKQEGNIILKDKFGLEKMLNS